MAISSVATQYKNFIYFVKLIDQIINSVNKILLLSFILNTNCAFLCNEMAASTLKMVNYLMSLYLSHIDGDEITPRQLQLIYQELRPQNSLSLRQIKAAVETVCLCSLCFKDEVFEVLKEMDRRYCILRDLEWEFHFLNRERRNSISSEDAMFLLKALHGDEATRIWQRFTSTRELQNSRVTLAEIEIFLCEPIVHV